MHDSIVASSENTLSIKQKFFFVNFIVFIACLKKNRQITFFASAFYYW
jgi:hypothetical protein